jgi:hypothetical protein
MSDPVSTERDALADEIEHEIATGSPADDAGYVCVWLLKDRWLQVLSVLRTPPVTDGGDLREECFRLALHSKGAEWRNAPEGAVADALRGKPWNNHYRDALAITDAILARLPKQAAPVGVIGEIAAERRRQVEQEGWTIEHDDGHAKGELAIAASCYALHAGGKRDLVQRYGNSETYVTEPRFWPWSSDWWKPKSPRRDLIRAAALIVAEIERLDRLTSPGTSTDERKGDYWHNLYCKMVARVKHLETASAEAKRECEVYKNRLFGALDRPDPILVAGLYEVDHARTISRSVLSDVLDVASVQKGRAEAAEADRETYRKWAHAAEDQLRTTEARAEAAEAQVRALREALTQLHAFVAIMIGRGPDAVIPETIASPLGPPIKIGEIMREVGAALSPAPDNPQGGEHV